MQIVGGMAGVNSVTIETADHRSRAFLTESGEITSTVQPVSGFERKLQRAWWVPRFAKLLARVFLSLPRFIRWGIVLFPVAVAALVTLGQNAGLYTADEVSATSQILNIIVKFAALLFVIFMIRRAAGFHAAEHKAIHAYEKHDLSGLDKLAQQSRIHDHCGGRLAAPFLLVGVISTTVTTTAEIGWFALLLPFILLELVLRLDEWVGYQNIALTQEASVWLQHYLTTREPTETELTVGREALRQLLIAAEELPANEPQET